MALLFPTDNLFCPSVWIGCFALLIANTLKQYEKEPVSIGFAWFLLIVEATYNVKENHVGSGTGVFHASKHDYDPYGNG